jgi:hypothetical protein
MAISQHVAMLTSLRFAGSSISDLALGANCGSSFRNQSRAVHAYQG